ncbi:MAG TPA: SRPBCC family protein [Roseiflexaceae bacterium]|nr:SRPBCC family protein [Roseiflexaceae bacterium]
MNVSWQGTIHIHTPVEQVYDYLADLPSHAEWAQSVERLELVQQGDGNGVGAVYRTAERQAWQTDRAPRAALTRGVAGTTMCEMVELDMNRRIAWRSWAPVPGVKHEGAYAFELASDGNGGTRLTQSAALEDNWLGDIVSRLLFKTTPEKARAQWDASLRNIKVVLEHPTEVED